MYNRVRKGLPTKMASEQTIEGGEGGVFQVRTVSVKALSRIWTFRDSKAGAVGTKTTIFGKRLRIISRNQSIYFKIMVKKNGFYLKWSILCVLENRLLRSKTGRREWEAAGIRQKIRWLGSGGTGGSKRWQNLNVFEGIANRICWWIGCRQKRISITLNISPG